jgi:glycosyltransferase involved in cell wall biosynthesis
MVERVESEYKLAQFIRVSSDWSRETLIKGGVPGEKVVVFQQPVDTERFVPKASPQQMSGPLRVCFVGSLDLRKGFVYLLRALQGLEGKFQLEIVGATGDRRCRSLFERERRGVNLSVGPGDPLGAYHRAELFVLPTLEDGSPFAVAEAMSSGLPVIVTSSCGSAEWVTPEETGWVVSPRNVEELREALELARSLRPRLRDMGAAARAATLRRVGEVPRFTAWLRELRDRPRHESA